MIASATWIDPANTVARVVLENGEQWDVDSSLPMDTQIRQAFGAWRAAGGVVAPFVAPPSPVPESISRRQCARELLTRGMISPAEAVAMTQTGAPPAIVEAAFVAAFDELPEPDRTTARALAAIDFAAGTYARSNPLLVSIMQGAGASDADIDEFFRAAAAH